MRRKENEISEKSELESIIARSLTCRLALANDNQPYIVPLCFGYKDNKLYFHSADAGRKIDMIGKNNNVCFEFDIDQEIVKHQDVCHWGIKYRSIIGFGKAFIIEDEEQKREMMDIIMNQYSEGQFEYSEDLLEMMVIIKVDIEEMTGKQSGV